MFPPIFDPIRMKPAYKTLWNPGELRPGEVQQSPPRLAKAAGEGEISRPGRERSSEGVFCARTQESTQGGVLGRGLRALGRGYGSFLKYLL